MVILVRIEMRHLMPNAVKRDNDNSTTYINRALCDDGDGDDDDDQQKSVLFDNGKPFTLNISICILMFLLSLLLN